MKNQKRPLIRVSDPFDASAQSRLVNMGLVDAQGKIDSNVMPVFAGVFSGLFFDDICDHIDDMRDLKTVCSIFEELLEKEDYEHMYLFLSIQYDNMRKPLPDPIWWLAGDSVAIAAFMKLFMQKLMSLIKQKRLFEIAGGGE